jgi:MoCo/4Fe-4S cofactor protein with predicted Tat translocation signal
MQTLIIDEQVPCLPMSQVMLRKPLYSPWQGLEDMQKSSEFQTVVDDEFSAQILKTAKIVNLIDEPVSWQ